MSDHHDNQDATLSNGTTEVPIAEKDTAVAFSSDSDGSVSSTEDADVFGDAVPLAAEEPVLTHQVGQLRLIGILDPLSRPVDCYLENEFEPGMVRNVTANSDLTVRAFVCQGERRAVESIWRTIPDRYPGEQVEIIGFFVPFGIARPEMRHVSLPPGFRRYVAGFRPVGTTPPERALASDEDGPRSLVQKYNQIWRDWLRENRTLSRDECDVGLIAWPVLPCYEHGMETEIAQKLKNDSFSE
ncbi:hypothetical protein F53441_12319 [Fusarium austroafricanum]|uniref:Uncharacterized protein n=1 Tax=Fusarium austroafricanum TaxID=2364996 RepID=A0A8H4NQE7_9HYPO|nr:hypothetical protein F53441_12319 [Fusarium austroafricanum]